DPSWVRRNGSQAARKAGVVVVSRLREAWSKNQRRCREAQRKSGEGGIRTRGEIAPTRHFQCRTFGRSVTSPQTAWDAITGASPCKPPRVGNSSSSPGTHGGDHHSGSRKVPFCFRSRSSVFSFSTIRSASADLSSQRKQSSAPAITCWQYRSS